MPSKVLSTFYFGRKNGKWLITVTGSGCVQVKLSRKLLGWVVFCVLFCFFNSSCIYKSTMLQNWERWYFRGFLPPEFCISATTRARGILVSQKLQWELWVAKPLELIVIIVVVAAILWLSKNVSRGASSASCKALFFFSKGWRPPPFFAYILFSSAAHSFGCEGVVSSRTSVHFDHMWSSFCRVMLFKGHNFSVAV